MILREELHCFTLVSSPATARIIRTAHAHPMPATVVSVDSMFALALLRPHSMPGREVFVVSVYR